MDRNLEILDHCSYCIPFKSKSNRQPKKVPHEFWRMLKILIGFGRLFFFEDEITCLLSRDFPSEERNFRPVFGFGSDDSMSLSLS